MEWDLNFYCTVLYIATMLHITTEQRGRLVASRMYHIMFIKKENIAVDEIGRIIYVYIFCTSTSMRPMIFLYKIIMHA